MAEAEVFRADLGECSLVLIGDDAISRITQVIIANISERETFRLQVFVDAEATNLRFEIDVPPLMTFDRVLNGGGRWTYSKIFFNPPPEFGTDQRLAFQEPFYRFERVS